MHTQRRNHITEAFQVAPKTGHVVECGVGNGRSLRWLAQLASPRQRVFGFDSGEGLPEAWQINEDTVYGIGSFKYDRPDIKNAEYWRGLFDDTLPVWKSRHAGRIAFLHFDADLYSSCVTVLANLNERLTPGTIIVMDDIHGTDTYKYWKSGEFKAFNEWQQKYNREVYQLSRGDTGEASFRVIE